MYLYSRQVQLALEHRPDGVEWAVDMTAKVNEISDLQVSLWAPLLSPGVTQLSFVAVVESLAEVEVSQAKMLAEPMYQDLAKRGAKLLTGSVDDESAQYVTDISEMTSFPSYTTIVRASLANGSLQKGIAAGVEIAEAATKLTGLRTSFLVATTGVYGAVAWVTGAETFTDIEQAGQKVNSDPDFLALVDGHSTCYIAGAATQTMAQRIV